MYSQFLKSRHDLCKQLVNRLQSQYEYVSILGKHVTGNQIRVTTVATNVGETSENQCGFVVKIFNGKTYSEYSFSDITENNIDEIERQIKEKLTLSSHLLDNHVDIKIMSDEPLVKNFERPMEEKIYSLPEIVEKLTALKNKAHTVSDKIVQVVLVYDCYECSSLFISKNKELTQNYSWNNIVGVCVSRDGSTIQNAMDVVAHNNQRKCFDEMETKITDIAQLSVDLLSSELITPGVYDIITAPSITGLIAHEAFGHGVEMDMFVKHRAKARHYINKPVASPLVNMHDGAAAVESCVGYFFDDDGVLAHDTLIIKDGILQTGISDAVSAMQLGTEPTGNGRRQDTSRKAYTRMTNTFFAPGKDKVEDMIKSVKHGYMLFQTSNGMEDPKNWNIQCVAQYGREIKDGKFTGKLVSPVVMSGYVPDLLQSISMVSDEWEVIGSGHCGKGYKEWVPVSDGGPYLKARCKLG